jgi:hypothetical protein
VEAGLKRVFWDERHQLRGRLLLSYVLKLIRLIHYTAEKIYRGNEFTSAESSRTMTNCGLGGIL